MNNEQPTPESHIPCAYLRSKEMFYQSFDQPEDEYSSGVYWCCKTQEGFGPDGQAVGKKECCAGRGCYID